MWKEGSRLQAHSRFSQIGDGSSKPEDLTPPTNGQKWWAAVLIGIIAFIIFSPSFYSLTNQLIGDCILGGYCYPNLLGLLLHVVIFVLIIRLLLW